MSCLRLQNWMVLSVLLLVNHGSTSHQNSHWSKNLSVSTKYQSEEAALDQERRTTNKKRTSNEIKKNRDHDQIQAQISKDAMDQESRTTNNNRKRDEIQEIKDQDQKTLSSKEINQISRKATEEEEEPALDRQMTNKKRKIDEETPITTPSVVLSTEQVSQLKLNAMQQVILMAYDTSFTTRSWPMDSVAGKSAIPVFLERDDLVSLIAHKQELTVAIIQIFLMYMNRRVVSTGQSNNFGFICPIQITERGTIASIKQTYLSKRLSETKPECLLAPYVHDNHWQLVFLCKKSYTVVFFCSLHYKPGNELKNTMNLAMRTYRHVVGGMNAHELKNPKWITPKTRRQPPGSNLCGFYVLRHIFNIIALDITEFTQEMFDLTDPFPKEDIDFIRKCCCEFIYELLEQH